MSRNVRVAGVLLVVGVLGAPMAASTSSGVIGARAGSSGAPDQVGVWTPPFEEGGASTPRCVKSAGDGRVVCKPEGYALAPTPEGRIFYFAGLEGLENVRNGALLEMGDELRNSRSRVLDLRSGTPVFSVPGHPDGGARNPNIRRGDDCRTSDLLGVAGVPGRPGDGFVGSLLGGALTGTSTGVEHQPTCTPDTGDTPKSGDMFCANIATLADGEVMVIGGSSWYQEPDTGIDRDHGYPTDVGLLELEGLRSARIYDPYTNDFRQAAPMKYGRWYPGVVTLGNGDVLALSGVTKLIKTTQMSQVRRTETYDPATNVWTENYTGPASENSLPMMPRVFLTPDDKVLYAGGAEQWGPDGEAVDQALWALQQEFNLQTRQWEIKGPNPLGARNGDFLVSLPMKPPYDRVTLLDYGGDLGPSPSVSALGLPFVQRITVDSHSNVTNELAANLHHARWFPTGVVLPDGRLLALNGTTSDGVLAPGADIAIHDTELYDPATNSWTDMAPESRDRGYHNAAILLPDARVLSSGNTPLPTFYGSRRTFLPGVTNNAQGDPSFQVWSPPYLFYGPRPRITHAPHAVAWGSTFTIEVDDPSSIRTVMAMRTPGQQHVVDSNTRELELAFTRTGPHTLTVTAPPTGTVAPPGLYYLFVDRQNPKGLTPSVARLFFIGDHTDNREAVQPMPDDPAAPGGGSSTPVGDNSYQAAYLGENGRRLDRSVAGAATTARDPSDRPPGVLGDRLSGWLGARRAGAGPMVAGVLIALALGLGMRTRRRVVRRLRRMD